MPENIISKRCYKCKEIKSVSEFNRDRTRIDGLCSKCRECGEKYKHSREGKEVQRKANKKYAQTTKGKDALKRTAKKQNENFPEKMKAKHAVAYAVRKGEITRPEILTCNCGEKAEEYHHLDYTSKKGLNVVPTCIICHRKLHRP